MENDFQRKKINAKEDFTIKVINAIKTQLVVTTGTNLFQHWITRNLKLNKIEPCARQQYAKF